MKIFTIGYEKATQAELIAALEKAGVQRVIDVRAVPQSRRPGFSKNILANGLAGHRIDYAHLRALGTPPEGREAARRHDIETLDRVYSAQLEQPEAIVQIEQMLDLAKEKPSALLCYERDPSGCHRTLLLRKAAPRAQVIDLFP
jgi:uncharacterized protein (DUF488 family)